VSALEQANRQAEQRAEQERANRAYFAKQNRDHTVNRFQKAFYRHHWILNPDDVKRYYTKWIIDPDNPLPEVTDWTADGDGVHASAEFTCEGIRFRVEWDYKGGGDRAYWDDGWWPDWYIVARRRFLPFLTRRIGPFYTPEGLAWAASAARAENGQPRSTDTL
jgi:hypothetical protein